MLYNSVNNTELCDEIEKKSCLKPTYDFKKALNLSLKSNKGSNVPIC